MIHDTEGNLLRDDAEALVNTVNCVGYMGKGIALQFKQAFPANYVAYERACKRGDVKPGRMLVFETGMMMNPKYIINFPTKRHWRGNARLEDIRSGLRALIRDVQRLGIRSIAVPPLGCGNGGLDWRVVRPMIVGAFEALPDVQVSLYAPIGTPEARLMPVGTKRPTLTPARALVVKLMEQYAGLAYRLTLLEVQKLAYFLQEAGESLRLRYEPGHFGPYAANLNKVLERLEGHFIRGYGDSQRPDQELELVSGVIEQVNGFLARHSESSARLRRVSSLIEGFETPYGMELLSSVHWVSHHTEPRAHDGSSAIEAVHSWNDRKRLMFKPDHILSAWETLRTQGWVPE
jgi:O-acetyl-ADP-ribose deacetylase (regulator of RNase III)